MKRRLPIILFLLGFVFAGLVVAQNSEKAKPNFSGTWILDEWASEDFGKFMNGKKTKIVIEHTDPQIKVIETIVVEHVDRKGKAISKNEETFQKIFFTDKRGEENTTSGKTDKSLSRWDGKRILSEIHNIEQDTYSTTKYTLSNSDKRLTVTFVISIRGGPSFTPSKLVYKRVSD